MPIPLSPLPYREDALEPWISARTVDVHYHKHHKGYVTRMNNLLKDKKIQSDSLDNIVRLAWKGGHTALFNAASQAWNHEFFWGREAARRRRAFYSASSATSAR